MEEILFDQRWKLILLRDVPNVWVFSLVAECLMYDAFLSEILKKHVEFRSAVDLKMAVPKITVSSRSTFFPSNAERYLASFYYGIGTVL